WKAGTIAGLTSIHGTFRSVFVHLLDQLKLSFLPIGKAPLVVLAVVVMIGIGFWKSARSILGRLTGDLTLVALDAGVNLGERLIRHRTASLLILVVLAALFGVGTYRADRDSRLDARAIHAYESWLDAIRTTIRNTTLASEDADQFALPLKL